jgi:hypothetical protein
MKMDELKRAKDERSFQPFQIRMADGREIEVGHPDAIAWESDQARIAVCMVKGGGWEIIDVALITSLGIPAPKSGRPKGRRPGTPPHDR